MPGYLSVAEFKSRTIMPSGQIDELERRHSGWLDATIEASSRWTDMWLAKRYDVPFAAPYPEAVKSWVARMVTARAYLHFGVAASDAQQALVTADADKAEEEIKQAADGQLGLIDIAAVDGRSGVSRGGPRVYSEASPYVGSQVQRHTGRTEDRNGRGT